MSNKRRCWASPIGGCGGGPSGEHYCSETLWGKRIQIRGFHWCKSGYKDIPTPSAKARVLCQDHNNKLSPVDAEAGKLKTAILSFRRNWEDPDPKKLWTGPVRTTLSLGCIRRWLCKTHCDIAAIRKEPLDPSYVYYSFNRKPPQTIYFYWPENEILDRKHDGIDYQDFYLTNARGQPSGSFFWLKFWGLEFFVALFPWDATIEYISRTHDFIKTERWTTQMNSLRQITDFDGHQEVTSELLFV